MFAGSTFGHQTQVMLVAPACTARSWKCRQALTKSAAVFPFLPGEYGSQVPFISGSSSRKNG